MAEREQNRRGVHVRIGLVVCGHFAATTTPVDLIVYTMVEHEDHIGPYWPGYTRISNMVIL